MSMIFYKQKRGSPWMNSFAAAERWLNKQENDLDNLDNIERPITNWVFVKYFNVEVKVVLDRPATVRHGAAARVDNLRNLAHGRAG